SHEVNQVFFDDVRVPARNLLGDEDNGWTISKVILSYERFGSAETGRSIMALRRLKTLSGAIALDDGRLIDRSDFRERLVALEIDLRALETTERRLLLREAGGAEASLLKIRGSEIQNEIFAMTAEAL